MKVVGLVDPPTAENVPDALDAYAATIRASEQPIHGAGLCVMCDNARVASIEHEPYASERERYAALIGAANALRPKIIAPALPEWAAFLAALEEAESA